MNWGGGFKERLLNEAWHNTTVSSTYSVVSLSQKPFSLKFWPHRCPSVLVQNLEPRVLCRKQPRKVSEIPGINAFRTFPSY